MTSDNNQITQRAAIGGQTTQIGIQNNYNGISPEQASEIAINLFMENFPKLQNIAIETARKRAEEFCTATIEKIIAEKIQDFSAFADTDVQYVLYHAQRDYARIGTNELLEHLTSLLCMRVVHDEDFVLKATIDKAMEVAPYLLPRHFDLLVIYFIVKHVKLNGISTPEQLQQRLSDITAPFAQFHIEDTLYLNTHGCFEINIGNVSKALSKIYGFTVDDIKRICPPILSNFSSDYGLSYIGKILAITHYQNKTKDNIDPRIWIK